MSTDLSHVRLGTSSGAYEGWQGLVYQNPAILGSHYLNILRTHHVSHVYNHWTAMPPLSDQHRLLEQTFTAPHVVIRLLTPLELA